MITGRGNHTPQRKTCLYATLSTTNHKQTILRLNPSLHSEKTMSECLRYGMASQNVGLVTVMYPVSILTVVASALTPLGKCNDSISKYCL
jgi:hypothetical protein